MAQAKGATFYVRVPPDMAKDVKKQAEKEYRTISNLIRTAVELYLKAKPA